MTSLELKTIFEKDYNRAEWLNALRDIFHIRDLHAFPKDVELPANNFGAAAFELGFFETSEGLLIGLFEVSISPAVRLERNKAGLRNMMRRVYQRDMDAALIVFTQESSWRFSYASELTVVNKETGKREKRQTDPRRYTYLLGRGQLCRTAAERFASLETSTDLFDTKISIHEIEKAFSVDILTKDFYRDLSNWYFWALSHVTFPDDDQPNAETRNPINLIRLITRLIFVWFLKQKGLVPDTLFDKKKIWPHLNFGYESGSTYYKAILQNLFFATLNQEMGKRTFRKERQHYNITNLYRYKKLFHNPDDIIELFKNIPFLNGGLFECLDKPHPTEKTKQGSEKIVRIDGFSDRDDNPLRVPDYLFFGGATAVDLSLVCDDKRQKNVTVGGIIEILNNYNFTVEENTPLEIQVALDPELLGKVFENLLASYNPETKTHARKQTGSFYTPREIVNYMVDESLIAYLKQNLMAESNATEEEIEVRLRDLVSYSGNGNPFDAAESKTIVKAIDSIKVLDPACGSGAFPMGILQQLVHVLQKLDPDNHLWKQLQMQRAQTEIQEAIASGDTINFAEHLKEIAGAFENNAEDYGRKLYLIENCIYGVDIQPIAVQISKLRFFISLLVDQTINLEADNLGIRALPNLETKFVAANSLIPIQRYGVILRNNEVLEKEKALEKIRHKYFIARTPDQKRRMRAADEELRGEIARIITDEALQMIESNALMLQRKQAEYEQAGKEIKKLKQPAEIDKYTKRHKKLAAEIDKLKTSIINPDMIDKTAKLLANWNPYEQNKYAGFFDQEWMFGIKDGFDVVIGNPPYVSANNMSIHDRNLFNGLTTYKTLKGKWDLYIAFIERSLKMLSPMGSCVFIVPFGFLNQPFAIEIRQMILDYYKLFGIVDLHNIKIFENATVPSCIPLIQRVKSKQNEVKILNFENGTFIPKFGISIENYKNSNQKMFRTENLNKASKVLDKIKRKGNPLENQFYCSTGAEIHGKEKKATDGTTISGTSKFDLLHNVNRDDYKPYIEGASIPKSKTGRYSFPKVKLWLDYNKSSEMRSPKFKELFENEKIIIRRSSGLLRILAIYDKNKIYTSEKCILIIRRDALPSSHTKYLISVRLNLKFLLGILNSKLIDFYYASVYGGFIDVYPNNLKELPICETNERNQLLIISLVDKILSTKTADPSADTDALENRIDELVYKLYDLTYDEVKVIDPEFWLRKEEYEIFKIDN
jgi:adenine-specific DNA-methyltransferase